MRIAIIDANCFNFMDSNQLSNGNIQCIDDVFFISNIYSYFNEFTHANCDSYGHFNLNHHLHVICHININNVCNSDADIYANV